MWRSRFDSSIFIKSTDSLWLHNLWLSVVVYRLLTYKTTILNLLCYICIGKRKIGSWQPKFLIIINIGTCTDTILFNVNIYIGQERQHMNNGVLTRCCILSKSMQIAVIFIISTFICCIVEICYRDNFIL